LRRGATASTKGSNQRQRLNRSRNQADLPGSGVGVPPPGLALRNNGHDWCATPRFSITPWASSGDPLALLTQFVAVRIADGRAGACDEKRVASAVVALPILTLDPSRAFAHGEGVLLDKAAVIAASLIALVLF